MTEKQRFIRALTRQPISGLVPHFELVFYLTMEAFGRVHPLHRQYSQWDQMSAAEQTAHLNDIADCYIVTAEKYGHSAIFVHPFLNSEVFARLLETIREKSGDQYFLLTHGDPTFSIPDGSGMLEFTARMYEAPEELKEQSRRYTDNAIRGAEYYAARPGLLDGYALCADYCFNTNPFFSPELFGEFIAPDLQRVLTEYRNMGFYTIKHTDGNIMPILDQLVQCGPDALHSLDPQGGVDLAEVKRLVGDRAALCGNVNCGLLQTGTDEECVTDIRRSLRDGMNGFGYIFCTSNCAYTGLPLRRYELMVKIWREEGVYPEF